MIYLFDGSYYGFLTAIFESFERRHFEVKIFEEKNYVPSFFEETFGVITDISKAERVLKGLKARLKRDKIEDVYKVFLSENTEAWESLFYIIQKVFQNQSEILQNFADAHVMTFDKTLTKVNRERHRMKAFIRFQKASDGSFYAIIEPDFNVLPLILKFFKTRYADQKWLIYDVKRKYGMYYDLLNIHEVILSKSEENSLVKSQDVITIDEKEEHFQTLWQRYYKSTNIEARRNMKLHLQHVPRRYWKYLTEKINEKPPTNRFRYEPHDG